MQLVALDTPHSFLGGEALGLGRGEGGAEAVGGIGEAGHQGTPVDAGAVQRGDLLRLEFVGVFLHARTVRVWRVLTFGRYLLVAQDRLRFHHHDVGGGDGVDLGGGVNGSGSGRYTAGKGCPQCSCSDEQLASHAFSSRLSNSHHPRRCALDELG